MSVVPLHRTLSLDASKVRVREGGLCIDGANGTIFIGNDEIVENTINNSEAVLVVSRRTYRRLTGPSTSFSQDQSPGSI